MDHPIGALATGDEAVRDLMRAAPGGNQDRFFLAIQGGEFRQEQARPRHGLGALPIAQVWNPFYKGVVFRKRPAGQSAYVPMECLDQSIHCPTRLRLAEKRSRFGDHMESILLLFWSFYPFFIQNRQFCYKV